MADYNAGKISLESLKDVFGVSEIKMDTSGNLTAGTANRLCIETDTGRVLYDNGTSFVEVGLSESQIALTNLESKAHSELSDAPTGAHHNAGDHEDDGTLEITHNNLALGNNDHHQKHVDPSDQSATGDIDDDTGQTIYDYSAQEIVNAVIPDVETLSYTDAFATGQIPNLDASKITSGELDDVRIPDVETLSYTDPFATGQIPNLDASKITSGELDPLRVPEQVAYEPGMTNFADTGGSWVEIHRFVLDDTDGEVFELHRIELQFKGGGTENTSLSLRVRDVTNGVNVGSSINAGDTTYDRPNAESNAGVTIAVQIYNNTGSAQDVSPIVRGSIIG